MSHHFDWNSDPDQLTAVADSIWSRACLCSPLLSSRLQQLNSSMSCISSSILSQHHIKSCETFVYSIVGDATHLLCPPLDTAISNRVSHVHFTHLSSKTVAQHDLNLPYLVKVLTNTMTLSSKLNPAQSQRFIFPHGILFTQSILWFSQNRTTSPNDVSRDSFPLWVEE